MRLGIDLAAKNPFRSGDGEIGNATAQRLAHAIRLLLDFGLGGSDHLFSLEARLHLGFLDDLLCPSFGLGNHLGCLLLAFANRIRGTLGSQRQTLPPALRFGQPFRYLRGPLVKRLGDRRPDELRRE